MSVQIRLRSPKGDPMKKTIKINNKIITIKIRESFASKEKVVISKKIYNRKKLKGDLENGKL
jgi:hypothetical protein